MQKKDQITRQLQIYLAQNVNHSFLYIMENKLFSENKLKISHFKELYKSLKTPFPPLNFLILGMLVGLEQRWIQIKTEQTVDMAIDEYHAKMDELSEPVYKAVIEETEDGGFTIGYFPEEKDETVS